MIKVNGYQPLDGDTVRVIAADGRQLAVGRTGVVRWEARGLRLDFHEPVADGSLFSEAFGLKPIAVIFTNGTVTLEQVHP